MSYETERFTTNDGSPLYVRWMIRRDMEEVLHIEHKVFPNVWTEEEFVRCLRQRNCIGVVAEQNMKVLGYMIYELHKNRLHVLNFAVDSAHWRRGVGSAMVQKLANKLNPKRRTRILLEVREANLPAQLFFRSQGFRAVTTLRDHYEDTSEDAYVMQYKVRADKESVTV